MCVRESSFCELVLYASQSLFHVSARAGGVCELGLVLRAGQSCKCLLAWAGSLCFAMKKSCPWSSHMKVHCEADLHSVWITASEVAGAFCF